MRRDDRRIELPGPPSERVLPRVGDFAPLAVSVGERAAPSSFAEEISEPFEGERANIVH